MTKQDNVYKKILLGTSDRDIRFVEIRSLMLFLGFTERTKGSHHIFKKNGVKEMINLQKDGNKAKAYQVKQVRNLFLKYKIKP